MTRRTMDEGTRKHFRDWCDTQGIHNPARHLMTEEFLSDPEYWGNQSYWTLLDSVMQAVRS